MTDPEEREIPLLETEDLPDNEQLEDYIDVDLEIQDDYDTNYGDNWVD